MATSFSTSRRWNIAGSLVGAVILRLEGSERLATLPEDLPATRRSAVDTALRMADADLFEPEQLHALGVVAGEHLAQLAGRDRELRELEHGGARLAVEDLRPAGVVHRGEQAEGGA